MSHDWPCFAIVMGAAIFFGLSGLFFSLWRRSARQLARAKEVIGVLSAPYVHPSAGKPFNE